MSNCSEIVALLSDYLDRDLPPDTCCAIDAHLSTCANCSEAAESLRRTVSLCRSFRSGNTPSPLNPERHAELRAAFEKVLSQLKV